MPSSDVLKKYCKGFNGNQKALICIITNISTEFELPPFLGEVLRETEQLCQIQ